MVPWRKPLRGRQWNRRPLPRCRFLSGLPKRKLVSAAQLAAANAVEFGMPLMDVSVFDANQNAVKLVSEELLQKYQVLPLFKRGNRLFVG